MSWRYNDDDFDGVVIKLETGFILQNPELLDVLGKLKTVLENCKWSTMMPSRQKNINEIEDYKTKSSDIQKNKKEEDERKITREKIEYERNRKKVLHQIIPIIIKNTPIIRIDEQTIFTIGKQEFEQPVTNKGGLKAEVLHAYNTFIEKCTQKEWYKMVCDMQWISEDSLTPNFDYKKTKITTDIYSNVVISGLIEHIQLYELRPRSKDLCYMEWKLSYDWDIKEYYFTLYSKYIPTTKYSKKGHKTEVSYLKDYKFEQGEFKLNE